MADESIPKVLNTENLNSLNMAVTNVLLDGSSVVIVGPSDAGKTFWIQNILTPLLESKDKSVAYSKDGYHLIEHRDIAIFDEAETLFDAEILKRKHPEEDPYYSDTYLKLVANWHAMYTDHTESSVYVISRKAEDVKYLVNHFNKSDWDYRNVKTFLFPELTR